MKTTKRDFERFQAEFTYWQKRFGLTEWEVKFFHGPLQEGRAAEVRTNWEARLCEAWMATELDYPAPHSGRHEALELLLDEMDCMARYRYIRPDEIDAARHAVIRRLENLLDEVRP